MADLLDEIFDMKPVDARTEIHEPIEVIDRNGTQTIIPPDGIAEDVDFNFVRANHYLLAQQASDALVLAMKIAVSTQDPKALKELTNALKVASEVNRQLLLLNKDKADTKAANKTPTTSPTSVTNVKQQVVFTGSSADLNKLIKDEE